MPKYLQFELKQQVGRTIPGQTARTKQVGETVFYENSLSIFQNQNTLTLEQLKAIPGLNELLTKITPKSNFYLAMSYSLNKSEWSNKVEALISRKL